MIFENINYFEEQKKRIEITKEEFSAFLDSIPKQDVEFDEFDICEDPMGGFIQEIKNVFSAISDTNFNVDEMAFVYPKISKNANLVMIKCKVSNSQTKILAPLYNFIDKEHSNEAKEIFRLCNTFSTKISNLEQIL